MSKLIKMTPECIEAACKELADALNGGRFADGKINFTKSLATMSRKATLFYTEIAALKKQALVNGYDKEVAWHGVATRGSDPEKDEYFITDILVYPQEVTGATVTTDQERYQMWLMNHEDDVFNNIRAQGHSHVNMGITPSGVDTSLYERLLEQLDDDMFYIFTISNKRGEETVKIYDLQKNVLFETADVTIKVLDDGIGIERLLADSKELVKDKPVTPVVSRTPGAGYGSAYSGVYEGYGSHYATSSAMSVQKTSTKPTPQSAAEQKTIRRKGRRKDSATTARQTLPYALEIVEDDECLYDQYFR